MAAPRPIAATLSAEGPSAAVTRLVNPPAGMPWWIVPVVVAAGAGGLALQLLLIFLWTIAKNSMH